MESIRRCEAPDDVVAKHIVVTVCEAARWIVWERKEQ